MYALTTTKHCFRGYQTTTTQYQASCINDMWDIATRSICILHMKEGVHRATRQTAYSCFGMYMYMPVIHVHVLIHVYIHVHTYMGMIIHI